MFGWTGVQALGEEICTILPFFALLAFFDRRLSRRSAIVLAALGISVIFALVHLPIYPWNLPQALIGLVPVRIVLLMPYLMTRNIWVFEAVPILNDWTIFSLAILGASAP